MSFNEILTLKDFTVEYLREPLGLDVIQPRFGWKICSRKKNVMQAAYRIRIFKENQLIKDTGKIKKDTSISVTVKGFKTEPKTRYRVCVTVWDNKYRNASMETFFETGKLGDSFWGGWVEPDQEPTPGSMDKRQLDSDTVAVNMFKGKERDYSEFRPAQYIRIPFVVKKGIRKARVYMTAHGLYRLSVNGHRADDRELAPENTSYKKILYYQTYDITKYLRQGKNVLGIILADGWWAGRVGVSGDSCQYGDKMGILLECELTYMDGSKITVTGEQGVSATGPIIYSDLFVGEKYDAREERINWDTPEYLDKKWKPVHKADYPVTHVMGQRIPPVKVIKYITPKEIIKTPIGETVIDMGQVIAGNLEICMEAEAGIEIKLEHSEVLDNYGNFCNNILGTNKEQTDVYITKEGAQKYRPFFTYHGFRYVKVTGWPGELLKSNIRGCVFSSDMEDLSEFYTSDERINRLQKNIWWSQVANSISIPTDCPQREKAGWTGDIMIYAPTMCFNRNAGTFLAGWMDNVRADQLDSGAVPNIVPLLPAYEKFMLAGQGTVTSSGWGDAVIMVPYAVYQAYGDIRILEDNYGAMEKWMEYIKNRAANNHPKDYETWGEDRKERSRYLWNTDFHFGDWLIPSVVLGNPDGVAMMETAYATMNIVAPAYYAFSAKNMEKISKILGKQEKAEKYRILYENIRKAFIEEYLMSDGTFRADFQGIYVIALKNNLVTEKLRPKMVEHLCQMIEDNKGCLDTGFLSIPFLMEVLCENGKRDMAYRLLYQTRCPSWLYEIEKGATTIWESWGAIGTHGEVSTYSFNHYAFGCIGEWLYKEVGGLQMTEAGYRKLKVAPAYNCGLKYAFVSENTPYGKAEVYWEIIEEKVFLQITVPPNTWAEVRLADRIEVIGSGRYVFLENK